MPEPKQGDKFRNKIWTSVDLVDINDLYYTKRGDNIQISSRENHRLGVYISIKVLEDLWDKHSRREIK